MSMSSPVIGALTGCAPVRFRPVASVAMPFFYQQVQVTSDAPAGAASDDRTQTYLDGGVRQSMFLFESLEALAKAEAKLASASPSPSPSPRQVFMIRNGPTIAKVDKNANGKRDAVSTAERGYSLIVNQSEVTAIEAIRLRDDTSEMRVATADGFDRKFTDPAAPKRGDRVCTKLDGKAMFEPVFMACLQAFGRYKARMTGDREGGWILLAPQ